MLVNRIGFIAITFFMMLALSLLLDNTFIAGSITFVTVIIGYIIISYTRSKKRLNLLEEDCDPEGFLGATEKQRNIVGKNPKLDNYLNIDRSVGFIETGEFQKAKEILLSVDKSYLAEKNGTLLVYTINLITSLYELGEISYAEELYEKHILALKPTSERIALSIKMLDGERLFFLSKYEESKEKFEKILEGKISKRARLSITYRLAQIDEKMGDLISAKKKYKEVLDNGNKLWIAKEAEKHLKEI